MIPRKSLGTFPGGPNGAPRQEGWFDSPVVRDVDLWGRFMGLHRAMVRGESGDGIERGFLEAVRVLSERHRSRLPRGPKEAMVHQATIPVRAFLEEHYSARVRLVTLAELSGLSVYHLIRVFRAATGLSPYAYHEQVRVHRAAWMLRNGLPISTVAHLTGFADQSHLTRLFKRLTGVPPGAYQRSVLPSRPSQ